jgi:hypothetical protein
MFYLTQNLAHDPAMRLLPEAYLHSMLLGLQNHEPEQTAFLYKSPSLGILL